MIKSIKLGKNSKILILLLSIILISSSFFMFSCENSTQLRCATISEITSAGSENYGVRINFLNDSRLKEKYVDLQIKCNKICDLVFWEENQEKITLKIDDFDEWYSLTNLIVQAKGEEDTETFEKFSEITSKTYLFNYSKSVDITLRVVAGDVEENSAGSGQILVGSEPISSQYTLKIK